MTKIERIFSQNWYPLTLGLMFLPLWCLLVAVFGFIVWIPITKYHVIVAFALTLGTISWACQWKIVKSMIHCGLFSGILLFCGLYASLFVERAFDDLAYHKPPVIEMKTGTGWNPVWEYSFDPEHCNSGESAWYWSKHYSKADWIINAVFYAFSGNLNSGHVSRLLYIIAALSVCFLSIKTVFSLSSHWCFFLALAAAMNPFALGQCFSGEVDGALGILLTILFFAAAAYLKNKDQRLLPFIIAGIVIVTNIKFTGVVYVAVFLICMLLPYGISGFRHKKPLDRILTGSLIIATILALIVGINPYIHHLYYHYTPFYPLQTIRQEDHKDRQEFMEEWSECNVGAANRIRQFYFAYLQTKDMRGSSPVSWKDEQHGVHTITVDKISAGKGNGATGFRNYFVFPMWFSLFAMPFIRRREYWYLLIAVWASILIQPYIWFGRYIPHLWVIPVIVTAALLSQLNATEYRRRMICVAGFILFCMLASSQKDFPKFTSPANNGDLAYFIQSEPQHLFFDVQAMRSNGVGFDLFVFTTKILISDWLPDYDFAKTVDADMPKKLLGELGKCPVYLIADQEKIDSLEEFKLSRWKQIEAILQIRWQQFKRVWLP